MTHDLAVLFLHHADDATTRNNLAAVRHFNPGVPVVPVSNWGVKLSDGFDCRSMTAGWRRLLPSFRGHGIRGAWKRYRLDFERMWIWRNVDLVAYLWARWPKRPISARRWVIFEWDMYCNVSLNDFYGPSFAHPVVATSLQLPGRNDDFAYFNDKEIARMPESIRSFRMASNPWAGMLFTEEALVGIADRVHALNYCNGFCEVRVATVANSLGFTPVVNLNPASQRTLRAVTNFEMSQTTEPSIYHRVKTNLSTAA